MTEEKDEKSIFDIDDLIPDITEESVDVTSDTIDLLDDISEEAEAPVEDIIEDDSNQDESKGTIQLNEENLIPLLAAQLKQEGILPEEFEITKDTKQEDIFNKYKESLEESIYNSVARDFESQLIQAGFTEESLKYAKMLGNGIPFNEVQKLTSYDALSKIEYEGPEEKSNLEAVRLFLEETTKSKKIVEKTLESAQIDEDEFKELFDESKEYFKNKKKEEEQAMLEEAESLAEYRKEKIEKDKLVIKKAVEEGVVMGVKIPNKKKFQDGLYSLTEIIDFNGEKRNVSKFVKFERELQTNRELQLWAFAQSLFGNDILEKEKEDAKKEGEVNLLNHFSVTRTKGISVKEQPAKQINIKKHVFKF